MDKSSKKYKRLSEVYADGLKRRGFLDNLPEELMKSASIPSPHWTLLIISFVLVFCWLAMLGLNLKAWSWFGDMSDTVGTILQVVSTFLLGIFIFISESFKDDELALRAFRKKIHVWWLVVVFFSLMLLFYFWDKAYFQFSHYLNHHFSFLGIQFCEKSDIWIASVLWMLVFIGWLIYALWKMYYLTFKPELIAELKASEAYGDLEDILDISIQRRYRANYFISTLESYNEKIRLFEYSPFSDKANREAVMHTNTGYVTDIALNLLEKDIFQWWTQPTNEKIYLSNINYWDKVSSQTALAYISKTLTESEKEELRGLIRALYIISDSNPIENLEKAKKVYLSAISESIEESISRRKPIRLEREVEDLLSYISKNISALVDRKIDLGINNTQRYIGWFFEESLGVFTEIEDTIWKIHWQILETDSHSLKRVFMKFIFSWCYLAVRKDRENYAFFNIFRKLVYQFILKDEYKDYIEESKNHHSDVLGHIDNLLHYNLYPKIKECSDILKQAEMIELVLNHVLYLFKACLDSGNKTLFNDILYKVDSLWKYYDQCDAFSREKEGMFFGFWGYLMKTGLKDWASDILNSMELISFEDWLSLFLLSTGSDELDNKWWCGDWDLKADWETHWVDTVRGKTLLFLLGAYRLKWDVISFEASDTFQLHASMRFLNTWAWKEAIDGLGIDDADFVKALEEAVIKLKEVEKNQRREKRMAQAVPETKIAGFFREIEASYKKGLPELDSIFSITRNQNISTDWVSYWVNQFMEKEWFVDEATSIHWMWDSIGRNLSSGQQRLIIADVLSHAWAPVPADMAGLRDTLLKAVQELGTPNPAILVIGNFNYPLWKSLADIHEINWSSSMRCSLEVDWVKVPMHESYFPSPESKIVVFDKDKVHISIDAHPQDDNENRIEWLYTRFIELNWNEEMLKLIAQEQDPSIERIWKEWGYENLEDFLRDRIIFKLYYRVKIVCDKDCWACFLVSK